jgi:hypothetical protein
VVQAGLNVGLVADGGQAMGIAGAPQEDIRFGDIRIGARALSAPGTPGSTMADAVGFDYDAKTWAGDLVFNSLYKFGIGGTPGVQSDLYSVALHEAGHSFGLADQSTDPTSVLYAGYQGVVLGLSATDIASIQALYGARVDDKYEGATGNGTIATATTLGNLTALDGDLTRVGDVDVYKLTAPATTGTTGLTVNLQTAGISLLTAKVSILDGQGNTVASTATTDPLNNDLSIAVPNYSASSTYYVKVEGATTDVFSVGSYVLRLNYSGNAPSGQNADVINKYNTNLESLANNNSLASAMTLSSVQTGKANTFVLAGSLATSSDADWYKITPVLPTVTTGTLFVGTMATSSGLLPTISIYNAQGQLLPTVVTMNEGGAFEVQLPNATTGTTYYIRVAAANPTGPRSTGLYTLGATLTPAAPTVFNGVVSGALSGAADAGYVSMDVQGDRLAQFSLSASGGSATSTTAVRATVFDQAGHAVFTLVAQAGQPLSTGAVWLSSGRYTLVFNAATQDGSDFAPLDLSLSARTLSDPIDPYVEDPLAPPPPPLVPISVPTSPPVSTPPPIVDPITNPFNGTPTQPVPLSPLPPLAPTP